MCEFLFDAKSTLVTFDRAASMFLTQSWQSLELRVVKKKKDLVLVTILNLQPSSCAAKRTPNQIAGAERCGVQTKANQRMVMVSKKTECGERQRGMRERDERVCSELSFSHTILRVLPSASSACSSSSTLTGKGRERGRRATKKKKSSLKTHFLFRFDSGDVDHE